jgi:hypothetical protein
MLVFDTGTHITGRVDSYGRVCNSPDFASYLLRTEPRFEFANNEFITSVESIPLETQSTESGSKDFIVVGTTLDRGEDLAVRGAVCSAFLSGNPKLNYTIQTYIFEIAEVNPPHSSPLQRWWKLRLRCRDDAKGPVTAICGMNGYLVSSMGQKVWRRTDDKLRLTVSHFTDLCSRFRHG